MFEGDIRHSDIPILMIDHVVSVITVSTLSNSILVVLGYDMNLTKKCLQNFKEYKSRSRFRTHDLQVCSWRLVNLLHYALRRRICTERKNLQSYS